MTPVKLGSVWVDTTAHRQFVVISRTEIDGNVWIHYRNNQGKEFSCYEESFKQRFRENANEYKHQ